MKQNEKAHALTLLKYFCWLALNIARTLHVGSIGQEPCLGGYAIPDGVGQAAVFKEVGLAPASMEAAHSFHPGSSLIQSDAPQAYLQAPLRP
eukprot:6455056-Amphidinium_carterae.6